MQVEPLSWQSVVALWPRLAGFALQMEQREPDDWPVMYTIDEAASGRLLLWMIHDEGEPLALMASSVDIKPSGRRVGHIRWVAGRDHERWYSEIEAPVLAHFRERKCDMALTQARRGWQRRTPDGWTARGTIYRKDLTDG